MTTATATAAHFRPARAGASFDLSPNQRAMVLTACLTMSGVCLYAIMRGLLRLAGDLPHLRNIAVAIHVATVLPCIPLGGYLLLARKGTARHKQLGKLWLLLMLATAVSAIFIKSNGSYSFIHLFVPVTFHAAWKTVATAGTGRSTSCCGGGVSRTAARSSAGLRMRRRRCPVSSARRDR